MMRKRIAVFASGSGSNFQALVDANENDQLPYQIALLVCDRPCAKVLERAKVLQIPTFSILPKTYESKAHFEQTILTELRKQQIDFIVLAGYMRLIGKTLLSAYEGKIVNIHPSLLPAFPGKDAIGQALDKGVKITGVTIHYVDEGMDTGPIIAQEAIKVEKGITREILQRKIQKVEHELYPKTLKQLFTEMNAEVLK
jgi:phosphoribosylglycinamide formyltransferase 1